MFRVVLLGFLMFGVVSVSVPAPVWAISLDDDEEDAEDVADLLEQAKKRVTMNRLAGRKRCSKRPENMAQEMTRSLRQNTM